LSVRPVRGEARRDLILDAAIRVLGAEGVGALTHRRVAAEAGLPLAATTYWFASKDQLLVSAYRRAADHDIERVRRIAEQYRGGDLVAALTALVSAELQNGRVELVACFSMWFEAARRPELQSIEAEWTEAYEQAIEALLRAAGSAEPRLDAQALTAAIDGLLLGLLARGGDASDVATELEPQLARLVAVLTAPHRLTAPPA
jgi:TetR/AcrR family transcriptional regulator, regulator of biofilm formation and stress response